MPRFKDATELALQLYKVAPNEKKEFLKLWGTSEAAIKLCLKVAELRNTNVDFELSEEELEILARITRNKLKPQKVTNTKKKGKQVEEFGEDDVKILEFQESEIDESKEEEPGERISIDELHKGQKREEFLSKLPPLEREAVEYVTSPDVERKLTQGYNEQGFKILWRRAIIRNLQSGNI